MEQNGSFLPNTWGMSFEFYDLFFSTAYQDMFCCNYQYITHHYSYGKKIQFYKLLNGTFPLKKQNIRGKKSSTKNSKLVSFLVLHFCEKFSYVFITASWKLQMWDRSSYFWILKKIQKKLFCPMCIHQIHTWIFHLHFSIRNQKHIWPIKETM